MELACGESARMLPAIGSPFSCERNAAMDFEMIAAKSRIPSRLAICFRLQPPRFVVATL
ncbi:hypothetical protein OAG62_00210 [bacterium]|nr:hypothetical protein [bacterium]